MALTSPRKSVVSFSSPASEGKVSCLGSGEAVSAAVSKAGQPANWVLAWPAAWNTATPLSQAGTPTPPLLDTLTVPVCAPDVCP